jgi:hypothetical protein
LLTFMAAMTMSLAAIAWSPPAVNTANTKAMIEKAVLNYDVSCVTVEPMLPGGAATCDIVAGASYFHSGVNFFDVTSITKVQSGGIATSDIVTANHDNQLNNINANKITVRANKVNTKSDTDKTQPGFPKLE